MTSCPPADRLRSYERGRLGDEAAGLIESHLADCQRCRAVMDRLRATDPDVQLLRRAWREAATSGFAAPGTTVMGAEPTFSASVLSTVRDDAGPSGNDWRIPDYERVQLCGEGAFGSVWVVRDRVGVFRALKIIDMHKMSEARLHCRESTALEMYCRRVGRHPYLIDIYHVGIVGDQLYYTMELADNDVTKTPVGANFPDPYRPLTLSTVIRRRRISPDTAIEIARRLLRGLSRLHVLDLVHRDIKPSNIVFVNRRPKLADIGMITPGERTCAVAGTPRYMPPDRVIDMTADTYALGKVLHEMIAGPVPSTFPALPPEYLTMSSKWDLSKVNEVLIRACAPTAAERYRNGAEMLDHLEACADFPFRSLFDDLADTSSIGRSAPIPRFSPRQQMILALARTAVWVAGLVAIILLLKG